MAKEILCKEHQGPAMEGQSSRADGASHEIKNNVKRTRSETLKMMLEELASTKKESTEAMDEIEASKVKIVSGMEKALPSGNATCIIFDEECVGGSAKGSVKGNSEVNRNGAARKSYHAAVYRSSFQSSGSIRRNQHNTVSAKLKRNVVGLANGDSSEKKRDEGSSKSVVNEVSMFVMNERQSLEKGQKKVWESEGHVGCSDKQKGRAVDSLHGPEVEKDDPEIITISSDSERAYTPFIVDQDEEYWIREVFDAKKMRKNVLNFPANVIESCLGGRISNIILYDCDKGEPYYCEIKKRFKKKEKYLCGGWFYYAREADLKEGDKLHFVIRYPPVDEIMVYVERRGATPGGH